MALVLVTPIPSKLLSPEKKSVLSVTDPSVVDSKYLPTTILEAV